MSRFAILLCCTSLVPFASSAAQSDQSPPRAVDGDSVGSYETMGSIRNVGTATFVWLTDQAADNIEESRQPASPTETEGEHTVEWAKCPPISHEDLAAILVPTYIREIPDVDGWGHRLEFCLNRSQPFASRYVVGIRSSGRDGVFDNKAFKPAAFSPSDFDHDIVWLDGFFVAWPDRTTP